MLVLFGKLYIIEPTKRWSDKDESNNIFSDETSFVIPSGLENPPIPTLVPRSGIAQNKTREYRIYIDHKKLPPLHRMKN